MKRYALIREGRISEIISTANDINTLYHPDLASELIDVTGVKPTPVEGMRRVNGKFQVTDGVEKSSAAIKIELMNRVNADILPLQDRLDTEQASEAQKERLLALKRYRIQLRDVDTDAESIEWPDYPQDALK